MWNRDFCLLAIAEILLCLSCYMTFLLLPFRLCQTDFAQSEYASLTMIVFILGICVSGFFGCWLIQRFRRNKVFSLSAILMAATVLALSLFDTGNDIFGNNEKAIALMVVCLSGGLFFGQAKRVLSCTLLIDKTESCHRTDANYAAIWIARLMVVIGPMLAIQLHASIPTNTFYVIGAGLAVISAMFVMAVKFPFRAPEEGLRIISIDRFFLPRGWNVALAIALMSTAFGLMISTHLKTDFFSSVIIGFIVAIITLRFKIVRMGQYTSAAGNLCILVSMLMMFLHDDIFDNTLKAMLLGIGFGLTSSEQLYKLLNHSDHCQRSTVESTYFMASDGGLFLGIALGLSIHSMHLNQVDISERTAFCLFVVAAIVCSVNALVKKRDPEHHA